MQTGRKQAVLTAAFDNSGGIFGSNFRTTHCFNFPHARQHCRLGNVFYNRCIHFRDIQDKQMLLSKSYPADFEGLLDV